MFLKQFNAQAYFLSSELAVSLADKKSDVSGGVALTFAHLASLPPPHHNHSHCAAHAYRFSVQVKNKLVSFFFCTASVFTVNSHIQENE